MDKLEINRENELLEEIKLLKKTLAAKENEFQLKCNEFVETKQKSERNEKMLHSLVEAAAGKIGQDFFDNIVSRLADWLNVDCVLIGQMTGDERINAVPLYLDGNISHGFSYALKDTPCAITTRKGFCVYPENVINLFPKDKILTDLNAEGYIGTALYNEKGETNGVICAVSRNKIDVPPHAKDIMKIIGSRVTAEIERKKMEEAFAKSEAKLRESNAAKDRYFSILGHDLMNPLGTSLGFSEILAKDLHKYNDEQKKRYAGIIHHNTKNIIALLNNLLTWAKSEQGLLDTTKSKVDILEVVEETSSLLEELANKKQISLEIDVKNRCFVMANRNMLLTIFRNLISNAIKFTPTGGIIKIGCEQNTISHPGQIEFFVEDNGVGIKEENLDKIFNLDKNFTSKGTNGEIGTGLGLIMCKEFIEKNNGEITVSSEVGKGSRFSFTLDKVE